MTAAYCKSGRGGLNNVPTAVVNAAPDCPPRLGIHTGNEGGIPIAHSWPADRLCVVPDATIYYSSGSLSSTRMAASPAPQAAGYPA